MCTATAKRLRRCRRVSLPPPRPEIVLSQAILFDLRQNAASAKRLTCARSRPARPGCLRHRSPQGNRHMATSKDTESNLVPERLGRRKFLNTAAIPGLAGAGLSLGLAGDRKRVVEGTSVSVRVDLGGRRIIKKKKTDNKKK